MSNAPNLGLRIRDHLEVRREEMVSFLEALAVMESPTTVPETQGPVLNYLELAFRDLGHRVERISGVLTGGHLYAEPKKGILGRPGQLMVGHCDTVWSVGTLETMPVKREDGLLRGPGVFDMKGGLTLMVFALRALKELDVQLPAAPRVFINSDEEIGSPESRDRIADLAREVERAFILEPAMGLQGMLKTARKGVGLFEIVIRGQAAHAGLEPERGASAIVELSFVIQALHGLNDRERGITVNVGVIDGGLRPNIVAPQCRAQVDVRVVSMEDARYVEEAIHSLQPRTPGVTLEISGAIRSPPLERTPRNRALWRAALAAGREMGMDLEEVMAGGGSDGNTTSQFTATLDGMGPVGDGAHAPREHVVVDSLVERCALLARMLAWEVGGED